MMAKGQIWIDPKPMILDSWLCRAWHSDDAILEEAAIDFRRRSQLFGGARLPMAAYCAFSGQPEYAHKDGILARSVAPAQTWQTVCHRIAGQKAVQTLAEEMGLMLQVLLALETFVTKDHRLCCSTK